MRNEVEKWEVKIEERIWGLRKEQGFNLLVVWRR